MNSRFPSSRTPSSRPFNASIDVSINAPTATATALGIIPAIHTTIGHATVDAPTATATALGIAPEIVTSASGAITAPTATATALGIAPSVFVSETVSIDTVRAIATAEGIIPTITSAEGTTLLFKYRDIKDAAVENAEIRIVRVVRPLKKPLSSHKIEIPQRAGSWDFECGIDQDYNITVDIVITADTAENIMLCAKSIETYLSGKGMVRLTDDTTTHQGQIYEGVYIYTDTVGNYATATLKFECDAA